MTGIAATFIESEVPMIELPPQVIEKDGKKEFVVLPFEEFLRIEEELADYQDLQLLRAAKQEEGEVPSLSLSEVKAELGLS
jgi:hypothetical protein